MMSESNLKFSVNDRFVYKCEMIEKLGIKTLTRNVNESYPVYLNSMNDLNSNLT